MTNGRLEFDPNPDRGRVRRTDPKTSRQASRDNRPRTPKQQDLVLRALLDAEDDVPPGLTQDETFCVFERKGAPMKISSIAKRLGELIVLKLAHAQRDYTKPDHPIVTRGKQRVVRFGKDGRQT